MCTLGRSYSESHRQWAVPGDIQKGEWLSLPLGNTGRVAEWQVSEQMLYLQGAKLFYSVVEIFSHFGRKMLKRVGNTGRELHTHITLYCISIHHPRTKSTIQTWKY